jgi:hypothetical protein
MNDQRVQSAAGDQVRMHSMARLGFKTTIGAALALALAGGSAITVARAQTADPPPGPLAKPSTDPKDFTGVWLQKGYAIRYPVVGGGQAP